MHRRQLIQLAAAGATACLPGLPRAQAAPWPSRPIRLLTSGVGSVLDQRARWLAERLAPALGQPITVENLPAAGGTLAAQQVARATPDGHTLLLYTQGLAAISPHLLEKPGYDPLKELQPLVRFGLGGLVMVVAESSPWRSLAELADASRRQAGGLLYGTPGIGTPQHLASELLLQTLGVPGTHVPYNGAGRLMTALLGGAEVGWAFEALPVAQGHLAAGRLRALGVTQPQRVPLLPGVPTLAEAGATRYEYLAWMGLAAPAGTPEAVGERLHGAVAQLAQANETQQWLAQSGSQPGVLGQKEFTQYVREEHARLGALIRSRGLSPSSRPQGS
jgi:tripartite-type tricarboxylate transporter receptor subunit TctC